MYPRLAAIGSSLLVLSGTQARAQQAERFTLPAAHAAIYDLVGEIDVQPGTGKDVVIEITRGGRDAAQLTIEQGPVAGYDALRVIFPSDEIVYPRMSRRSSSDFQVRDDGTFGGHDNHGRRRGRSDRGRGDRVTVRSSGSGLEAYADAKILVPEGASFSVFVGVGKATLSNVNGTIAVDGASAPVSARGMKGSLSVDVGSGSVSVSDANGDLSIDTGSGTVEVTGITGNDLSIDTGSGEIRVSDVTVQHASVEAGSGSLTLSRVKGPDLHFETGSGSIDAELSSDVASLTVDTGSGDVVLRVPGELGATVDIETGSGGIQADMPLAVQRWSRDHVTGRIGDGEGRLSVDTGSGDVKIVRIGGTAP